ncbi:MAG: type II toxin-antitoxin system VapC family toxin [Candidatus Diapherotrites archaeon]|nr:type II toxin-antitoxin system VapC family toxin [Candidatus Diapherotrites archaeon]
MIALIDSCIWIDYFSGKNLSAKEFIEGEHELIISSINLAEVYRFMLAHKSEKEAALVIEFMKKVSFSIPVSDEIALKAAEIRYEKKLGLGDAIILATAVLNEAKVVTSDSDFKNNSNAVFLEK